ncbi:Crp/Fnr family transcriptional regulator [Methylobacterium terricola]|uniref:Crp/Fnr family transcriptional regulator n=2 Tax=Methylobacterium terricola TaxID=2583531 RepID=A0A5C4L9Y0_9HYPH|nr:Crp/Fnr family transcriptional regulator [Methylobacterium terricola]
MALRVNLDNDDIHALNAATEQVSQIEEGRDVVIEGEVPEYAHIILKGFACRYNVVAGGGRSIVAYLVPGDGCDLHASVLKRMSHSVSTVTSCTVASIPYRKIKEMAAYRPNIYLALWWSVLVDESILREWLVGVGRRSADRQVAHFLCEVLARLQAVGIAMEPDYKLPLTQSELADTAGLSHMHVHRVLTTLRKEGLIESKRKGLVVPDPKRLEAFANFDNRYLHLPEISEVSDPPHELSHATRLEFERRFN